ncbi:MAG: hypothetical protein LBU90_06830 [Bacteroidales bacterium]|jgi:hypothetical protein|nr:hypothetical protein [Bacteroidales bacterium]
MKLCLYIHILLCFLLCGLLYSCQKELYSTGASDVLTFSSDTVIFDTIFTDRATITHRFKVYNRNKGTVKIDEIYMAQSAKSEFFMNVNGASGPSVRNMELAAGDSMYIFVQAKLQENAIDTPRLHKDSLLLRYNNRSDKIILAAWGQDAHVLRGTTLEENTTWSGRKPYVIFDSLVVAENQTLTIEEGVSVYVHNKANIIVRGSLRVQGSLVQPVLFTSDRLEANFRFIPGQWGSILFEETSTNNAISYAIIRNGSNGLIINAKQNQVSVHIANTQILNMSVHAIFATNAALTCFNTVLADCGGYLAALHGGQFAFTHTTLSNSGAVAGRNTITSVFVSNMNAAQQEEIPLETSYFRNSIISGSYRNEIQIKTKTAGDVLPMVFDNCLLRQTFTEKDAVYYSENTFITNIAQPLFSNVAATPFSLAPRSMAINIGKLEYATGFEFDILNHSRILDEKPDAGAYEFFEYEGEK